MGWNEVDNKLKKGVDAAFVSCDEEYEKKHIIDAIMEEIPNVARETVEFAVEDCCKSISAPRPREEFVICVQRKLS